MASVPPWDIIECPQDGCTQLAESYPLYCTMNRDGGYTIHVRIRCMDGHIVFTERSSTAGS